MNRYTYLALAFVVIVSGYAWFSGNDDEASILESAVVSNTPEVNKPESAKPPQSVNTKKEDQVVLPKKDGRKNF